MAVFVYVEYLNTKAQLEISENVEGTPTELDSFQGIEEVDVVPLPQPSAPPENAAGYYSPVAIILATCALVTSIGKALRPSQQE